MRDHFKRSLDEAMPTGREWQADEDVLRARASRRRRGLLWLVPPLTAAAALSLWMVRPAPPVDDVSEVYLRVSAEPESSAMHIQLTIHERTTR